MWLGVGKGYAGFYRKSLAIFFATFLLLLAKTEHMFYYWLIGGLRE